MTTLGVTALTNCSGLPAGFYSNGPDTGSFAYIKPVPVIVQPDPVPVVDSTLVFHYKFNSGDINASNMLANYASGTAVYDATVVGTTAATIDTTNSKFGSGCLYLSAKSGYITLPSFTTDLNGYSISIWCKGTQLSTILHLTNSNAAINLIAMNNTAFYVFSQTALANSSTVFSVNDNIWNHMVFTIEYTTSSNLYGNWKIYKNGVLVSSNTNYNYPQNLARTTNYLGKHITDNTYNSIGYFDELRMYKRVLSATEVTNLYANNNV